MIQVPKWNMQVFKEDFVSLQSKVSINLWKNPHSSTGMQKASCAWSRSQTRSIQCHLRCSWRCDLVSRHCASIGLCLEKCHSCLSWMCVLYPVTSKLALGVYVWAACTRGNGAYLLIVGLPALIFYQFQMKMETKLPLIFLFCNIKLVNPWR